MRILWTFLCLALCAPLIGHTAAVAPLPRPTLLLFTGAWDKTSDELVTKTLTDRRLSAWISENLVPSGHDALAASDLTRRHYIRVVPTLVLLRPDGTELDRWTGPQKSSDLLRNLKDALAGKTSVAKARAKLKPSKTDDRFEFAESLIADGSYPAALNELTSLNDLLDLPRSERGKTAFSGPYSTDILEATARLAKLYPPAADTLRGRRARYVANVLRDPDREAYDTFLVQTIDAALAETEATLAFFRQLPAASKARDRLRLPVFKILIARQAYRDAADLLTAAEIIEKRGDRIEPRRMTSIVGRTAAPLHAGQLLKSYRRYLLTEWSNYFEGYAGGDDPENARTLARFILEHDKDNIAPTLLTAAAQRALGMRADTFLHSLEIPQLPAAPEAVASAEPNAAPPAEEIEPDVVQLPAFVVSETATGVLPLDVRWRRSKPGTNAKTALEIRGVLPRDAQLLTVGESILAIDGRSVAGMSNSEIARVWSAGNAGETVTLVIQGTALADPTYREVTVRRIPPPKRPRPVKP